MAPTSSFTIASRVDLELARIADQALVAGIRRWLVTPHPVVREWDYGSPGEAYTCWSVLEHPPSNTGIAYCESGFGPAFPWGLVMLSGEWMSIGMDDAWYASLAEAMRGSRFGAELNP
jgi:hypothetical protein